ncbi:MAG: hypothetical protein QW607_03910 [Desulfurococcaceae archaeon]
MFKAKPQGDEREVYCASIVFPKELAKRAIKRLFQGEGGDIT